MSTITLAPPQPLGEPIASAFGLPFTSRQVIDDLRRVLPPSTFDALDAITRQMKESVFDPLLYASSQEELRERFGRLFKTYWLQYVSASLQLASAAAHEPSPVATAIVRAFGEWKPPTNAAAVLGNEVAMMLASAIDVIGRVLRRSIRTLMQSQRAIPQERELEWLNGFVLFSMSVGPVLDSLGDTPVRGRRENLVLLTMWARVYAVQLYAVSRRLGWIPEAAPLVGAEGVPLATATDEEEQILAEAGIKEWAERLTVQEQDGESSPR
jgi:hypothetical protein